MNTSASPPNRKASGSAPGGRGSPTASRRRKSNGVSGSDGGGARGFPALNNGDWQWGGTFDQVMAAARLLQKYNVEFKGLP